MVTARGRNHLACIQISERSSILKLMPEGTKACFWDKKKKRENPHKKKEIRQRKAKESKWRNAFALKCEQVARLNCAF